MSIDEMFERALNYSWRVESEAATGFRNAQLSQMLCGLNLSYGSYLNLNDFMFESEKEELFVEASQKQRFVKIVIQVTWMEKGQYSWSKDEKKDRHVIAWASSLEKAAVYINKFLDEFGLDEVYERSQGREFKLIRRPDKENG